MSTYLDSIKNIDISRTEATYMVHPEEPLEVVNSSNEVVGITSVNNETPIVDFSKDLAAYSAPKKVNVKIYKLRK